VETATHHYAALAHLWPFLHQDRMTNCKASNMYKEEPHHQYKDFYKLT
jgi:hypothetical protein